MGNRYLQYGLQNNKLVHISDVNNGLECKCICPACKCKLIAKKGNKVIHHFAHYNAEECKYGYETALHLAAKEILYNAKKIIIPPLFLTIPNSYNREVKIVDAQTVIIDKVELEKIYNDIIPDIVVYSCGTKFFIEIYVTNAVDETKLQKIKNSKISTLEINLSKMNREISQEELKRYLINLSEEKYWIYNTNTEKWKKNFKSVGDIKFIRKDGFDWYVDNCPIISNKNYEPKRSVNVKTECLNCDYFMGIEEEHIVCTGIKRIATKEDYKKYIKS